MSKRSLLVTGGAGFIGSNFVEYILKKYPAYRLKVLDLMSYAGNPENIPVEIRGSKRFGFHYGNVCNSDLVDELLADVDTVVHFAAETHVARSIYDNSNFYQTDVLGTQAVANAVLKHKRVKRFIHISSSEVYGTAAYEPMDEQHPLNPRSPYASAKTGADRLVYSYCATYGMPAVIVRPFNNYGPRQHLEKLIPRLVTSAILDEPLTVHGSGKAERDWLYVEDCCEALDQIMHRDFAPLAGQVINLATGVSTSVMDIAAIVLRVLGKPKSLIKHISDRPGQVDKHIGSVAKSKKLLGWQAQTRLEEGLEQVIGWYQENEAWWRKLLWMREVPVTTAEGKQEFH